MDEASDKSAGWQNSVRRAGDTLLGLAQNRFELFAVELQEEKQRALGVIVWLVVALSLIVAGLLNMLVVLDAFDVAQGRK